MQKIFFIDPSGSMTDQDIVKAAQVVSSRITEVDRILVLDSQEVRRVSVEDFLSDPVGTVHGTGLSRGSVGFGLPPGFRVPPGFGMVFLTDGDVPPELLRQFGEVVIVRDSL